MNIIKSIIDKFRAKEKIVVICLLTGVCLIFPLLIFNRICFYQLPIGGDIGAYLKISYAIFENKSYPMWGDNLYQYPPLLFFIIYPVTKVLGDVWAINIIGLFLLVLRPLALFVFISKMFKNRFIALLGAGLSAFSPVYYSMYAWGGYDNLFGFVVLPIAFIYIFENSQCAKPKNFIVLFLFSTIAVLSHHLTSIVFLGTICLWSLKRIFKKQFKLAFLILFTTILPMIVYRLACGGVSDFTFFNEFAYYGCTINITQILAVFKDSMLLMFLVVLSAVGIYEFFRINKSGALLLLSWLLCPIIFYVGVYCTKFMAIDYVRLLYFLAQPLIIASIYTLKHWWEKRNKIIVLVLVIVFLFSSFNFAFVTINKNIDWYKKTLENKYSDINSYDMVIWIKENLPDNSTIVVRAPIIYRFIEGMAHKRVLAFGNAEFKYLKYLYKVGQYERALACGGILTSNILGYSDMFIIKDQTPILFSRTPYIYIFAGDNYELLGYFSDHYGWELKKLTSNVTKITISNSSYQVIYSDSYYTTKTVTLKNDEIQVSYNILKDPYKVPREKLSKSLYSSFWLPWGKNWTFSNNTLFTDYGEVTVVAHSVEFEYVPQWKQWRLVFPFNDELSVTLKMKNIRMTKGNVVLTTKEELIDLYCVTHALIRVDDTEAMQWARRNNWELVYNNDYFYLYRVK